jgi:hypothetical protein
MAVPDRRTDKGSQPLHGLVWSIWTRIAKWWPQKCWTGEKGMRHPRHQLVANTTIDEAYLQAGAMGCSSGFGARGRLGFTTALDCSTYSGVLKKVIGPVSLPGAQESQRADVCNAQEPLHRDEAIRITQHARKSIENKAPKQMRKEDTRILGKRRGTPPSSTSPSFSPAKSQQPSQAAFGEHATWTRQC